MGLLFYTNEYSPEKCKKLNKSLKVIYSLTLAAFIFLCYCVTVIVVGKCRYANFISSSNYSYAQLIEVKDNFMNEYVSIDCEELSRKEIYNKALEIVPIHCFLYFDVRPLGNPDALGGTLLAIRAISVDPSIDNEKYTIVLVHELLHLKRFTMNETYTQFETFRVLYESDNIYFHKAGLLLALEIFQGYYPKAYNCTGAILDYINDNTI